MILFNFDVSIEIFYLTIMLLVINKGLKSLEFVDNRFIELYLIVISVLINFIFNGITIVSLFSSFVSVSFALLFIIIYKKVRKIV